MRQLKAFLLILFFASSLTAQITADNFDLYATETDDTTFTLSNFTTTTNPNKIILCFVGHDGNSVDDITTYTFNGDSLTTQIQVTNSSAATAEMWYRLEEDVVTNGTATAGTVGFTVRSAGACYALYNVLQSGTFRDSDSAQSTGATSSSLSLTTEAGDVLFDCIYVRNGSTAVGTLTQSNGTELEEVSRNIGFIRAACRTQTATGTSVTADWGWTESSHFAHVAVTLIPDAITTPTNSPLESTVIR